MPERGGIETLVEGAAALGVSRIVPMVCAYCQERWWERTWPTHAARLDRKMIAAAKQSLNPWLTALAAPVRFEAALAAASGRLVAADQEGSGVQNLHPTAGTVRTVDAFVGPPGGFSPGERDALDRLGAVRLRLSPNRLRTELAAIALAARVMAPG